MTKNPDKWIRKGVIDALNGEYPIFDMRVPGDNYPASYIILSTQTKNEDILSKCNGIWDCSILLDIITRYSGAGNPGDRELVNDMEETVINAMNSFSVDGFELSEEIELESSTSLDNITDTLNVFRQLVRYRIRLEEI